MREPTHKARPPLPLRTFHLGIAGFLAFVLPFICWGALATPGHPHARPHFVFVDPPEVRPSLPAQMTLAEMIAWNLHSAGCGSSVHGADHAASTPVPGAPAGQAVPKVLIGTLILLVTMLAATWLRPAPRPEFSRWLCPLPAMNVSLRPTTPPPKVTSPACALSPT